MSSATNPVTTADVAVGTQLAISSEVRGRWLVLTLVGEIDSLTVESLRAAAEAAPAGRGLVVDLSGVGFLGSVGLSALLDLREGARAARFVVGGNRMVLRPLQLTGLDAQLALFADTPSALRD